MIWNLAPVWQFLDPAIPVVVTGLGAWFVTEATGFFKIKSGSEANNLLSYAMTHGDALLMDWVKSLESHNTRITVPASILTNAAETVVSMAPRAAKMLGLTASDIEPLLQARLNQALHQLSLWEKPSEAVMPASSNVIKGAEPAPAAA